MIENPVSRPIVPPTAASMSVNLAELSFVILSKGSASKNILKYLSEIFFSNTENKNDSVDKKERERCCTTSRDLGYPS